MTEEYLGDGLYASFDGYMIRLRAPRSGIEDHVVYLEPGVLHAFDEFRKRVMRTKEREEQDAGLFD